LSDAFFIAAARRFFAAFSAACAARICSWYAAFVIAAASFAAAAALVCELDRVRSCAWSAAIVALLAWCALSTAISFDRYALRLRDRQGHRRVVDRLLLRILRERVPGRRHAQLRLRDDSLRRPCTRSPPASLTPPRASSYGASRTASARPSFVVGCVFNDA
jgi:hypothetical protein